jgi:hypothetical protein
MLQTVWTLGTLRTARAKRAAEELFTFGAKKKCQMSGEVANRSWRKMPR